MTLEEDFRYSIYMETTAHEPFAKFEGEEEARPILGYEKLPGQSVRVPLVPNGEGSIVRASEVGKEYRIVIVEPDPDKRQILHG